MPGTSPSGCTHLFGATRLRRGLFSDSMGFDVIRSVSDARWAGAVWRPPAAKRGVFLLSQLVARCDGGVRVRALGIDRAGEVRLWRFLHNQRVTPAEMVETARARTLARVKGRHVLAIQDTTSLRDDGDQRSLHLHPTIAVDAINGSLLGLVDATLLELSLIHI